MNGKVARKLRNKAKMLSKGKPWVAYEGDPPTFLNGEGQRVFVPDCTKAIYKRLKKEYLDKKRANRG